jgi:hypothetical protein
MDHKVMASPRLRVGGNCLNQIVFWSQVDIAEVPRTKEVRAPKKKKRRASVRGP